MMDYEYHDECACCGYRVSAPGELHWDGDPLSCGCAAHWSVGPDHCAPTVPADPCPPTALCHATVCPCRECFDQQL